MYDALPVFTQETIPATRIIPIETNISKFLRKKVQQQKRTGRRTENKFLRAWSPQWRNKRPHCQWLIEVKQTLHSSIADDAGVDYVFRTELDFDFMDYVPYNHPSTNALRRLLGYGSIPLQLKSSFHFALQFERYDPALPIPVLYLERKERARKLIQQKTIGSMLLKFPELELQLRNKSCLVADWVIERLQRMRRNMVFTAF